MPRNVSDEYSRPAGTAAITGDVATAAQYNESLDDIAADLNATRPVKKGGTGVSSISALKSALDYGTAADEDVDAFLRPNTPTPLLQMGTNLAGNFDGIAYDDATNAFLFWADQDVSTDTPVLEINDQWVGVLNPIRSTSTDTLKPIVQSSTGKTMLQQITSRGGVALGGDDSTLVGCGESIGTAISGLGSASLETEQTWLLSDNDVYVVSGLQSGWANRKEWRFDENGNVSAPGDFFDGNGDILGTREPVSTSSELTFASGALYSFNHGLGRTPKRWEAVLRCKTANNGYEVGDEIPVKNMVEGDNGRGSVFWANSTRIRGRFDAAYIQDTGADTAIPTASHWRVVIYVW